MAQYAPSSTAGSLSGFGTSSPPPHLYDTSTSESSSGYVQPKSKQSKSTSQTKSTTTTPDAKSQVNANSSTGKSDTMNQQSYRQQQQRYSDPSSSNARRGGGNGNFKSAAALLVSSGNHSGQGSGSQTPSQPLQPPSPGRAAARRDNRHYYDGGFSDVSAPASFPSAAAHYIMSQEQNHEQQHQSRRNNNMNANRSSMSEYSTASRHKNDGTSVTELSSSAAPTVTTQSEPGGYSSHYSYFTLTDHYSSSSAASPDRRRPSGGNSRFAALEQYKQPNRYELERAERFSAAGDNQSHSQQPLLGGGISHHQQNQQQRETMSYSDPSRQPEPGSSSTPRNPFTSQEASRPGMAGTRKMSVSERIKRLNQQKQLHLENAHNNESYPDPEPSMDMMDDQSDGRRDNQNQQSTSATPLSPFHQPASVRRKKPTDMQPQQQQQGGDDIERTPQDALSRFRRRSEANQKRYANATTSNIDSDINSTNASTGAAPHSSYEYLPTAASSSKPEHSLLSDGTGVNDDDEKLTNTSLGAIRRRKPLQQPAYNPQQQEQQPQPEQHPNDAIGSPSRVQDLKRRLWTADEQLNVSYDQSNDGGAGNNDPNNRYQRAARSLSPGKHRHSTGSMVRPGLNGLNTSSSSSNPAAGAGFKSKFYQAAMAAQRGERSVTPPKSRPKNAQQGSPRHPTLSNKVIPGTPPRPRGTGQQFAGRASAGSEYPTPPRPPMQHHQSTIQATAPLPPTPPHHSHARGTSISPGRSRSRDFSETSSAVVRKSSLQQPSPMPQATLKHYPQEPYPIQHRNHHQQDPSHPTEEQPQPGNSSPPMSKEGKHYICKLMAKLNSVSRDDPQAALAQIDSILRAESRGSRSPDMTDSHAVLMNAAATAMGMPPLETHHQHLPVYPGQPPVQHMHQQYAGAHPPGSAFQNPHPAYNYPVPPGQHPHNSFEANVEEEDDDSDDETSVSSITNPTYRSEKPTHEQLHDVPPPKGISTTLYRRPRPNGLQNYATPASTPPIAGLELVQRHHERKEAKKGHLPTAEHAHAYNHHHLHQTHHHPPAVISVTASADEQDATKVFTENLIKSSKNQSQVPISQQQQESHGRVPYQEQNEGATRDYHHQQEPPHYEHPQGQARVSYEEQQELDRKVAEEHNQRALRDLQQQQRRHDHHQQQLEHKAAEERHQRAIREQQQDQEPGQPMTGIETKLAQPNSSGNHGMRFEPRTRDSHPRGQERLQGQHLAVPIESSGQQRLESSKPKSADANRERSGQSKQKLPTPQAPAKATPINPFDDSIDAGDGEHKDTEKPEYATRSIRKLDLFMSRKKSSKDEKEQLDQVHENKAESQLSGDQLARKVRAWDDLSTPASISKTSTKSPDGSEKIGVSSQASGCRADAQPATEMDAVNVSTASMSIGVTSSASKTSRRSHPWDGEIHSSKLKIDFRDTSMDNALGIEAECFSQSVASPARDLRKAARMQQQKQQEKQMRALEENERMHQQQMQMEAAKENERMDQHQQQKLQMQVASENEASPIEKQVSPARELRKERMTREALQRQAKAGPASPQVVPQEQAFDTDEYKQYPGQTRAPQPDQQVNEEQQEDRGFEVTPIYASQQQNKVANNYREQNYGDNKWVSVPSSSYFDATKKTKPKVVATLVDEDTHPVTMVRAPELPAGVVDAFADIPPVPDVPPAPYDERSTNVDRKGRPPSNRKYHYDAMDLPVENEHPPPRSEASSGSNNRGRGRGRAFTNFLKKRTRGAVKRTSQSPSPRMASQSSRNVGATEAGAPTSSTRGRRTASKSPAPNRDRARSLDTSIRNKNVARKFSRLLKVYGNETSGDDGRY